nr:MAG TPA: hypothetical protein [Caudoviricetes sp.]
MITCSKGLPGSSWTSLAKDCGRWLSLYPIYRC